MLFEWHLVLVLDFCSCLFNFIHVRIYYVEEAKGEEVQLALLTKDGEVSYSH